MIGRGDETRNLVGGHYEILRTLGEGGFAKVVKALHVFKKRWVAIKTIKNDTLSVCSRRFPVGRANSDMARRSLIREIEHLRRFRHKNIVRIEEVFYDDQGGGISTQF